MLDTHFMLGKTKVALGLEPDALKAFTDLLASLGAEAVAAVAAAAAPVLKRVTVPQVKLDDLERLAREGDAELLVGNSHAAAIAARLGLPLLRAGMPLYDRVGAQQRTWIGYRGTCQTLFEIANLRLAEGRGSIAPYRSVYRRERESQGQAEPPSADRGALRRGPSSRGPGGWLARAVDRHRSAGGDRFSAMAAEGWSE